jgi:hypothetical protein
MTEKSKAKRPARKPAVRRGRPPYRPTIEARQTVEEMKFCGESENTIARALGIDVDTMRKHFADELQDGHAQRRKEIIGMLFASARSGNVSAQKHLDGLGRAAGAQDAINRRGEKQVKPAKLGKKEEQQAAARAVASGTSKFAPPSAPKLVVDNR